MTNSFNRRSFLKTSLAGIGLTLGGSQAVLAAPKKWDKVVDVVVVGLGGAGASAAIEAHDAGVKVLIWGGARNPDLLSR